jgi:hypothetical protein
MVTECGLRIKLAALYTRHPRMIFITFPQSFILNQRQIINPSKNAPSKISFHQTDCINRSNYQLQYRKGILGPKWGDATTLEHPIQQRKGLPLSRHSGMAD